MTETKLSVLPCCCGVITASGKHECDNCKVLLAHEAYAEKMFDKLFDFMQTKGQHVFEKRKLEYWRGRLEAVQSLRGTK